MDKIVVTGFDGVLCNELMIDHFAEIQRLKQLRKNGYILVLRTARRGEDLMDAVRWCSRRGLRFDAVNTLDFVLDRGAGRLYGRSLSITKV